MRFIRFDGRQAVVEFTRKNMMHMKLLERKKALIEARWPTPSARRWASA